MTAQRYVAAAAAIAIGLVASACGGSSDSGTTKTETKTVTASATTSAAAPDSTGTADSANLQSLIPTPADTVRSDGPDSINDRGIRTHFEVNGSPQSVMGAYKSALEGKGWSLTVENSGGGGGGGGATYTGTNGDAFGVFTGGGYGTTTDLDACAWPSKPAHTHCEDE